jgi:hypothetical protein
MKLLLIMSGQYVIHSGVINSEDFSTYINRYCQIESREGENWIECENDTVDSAVYVDTDQGISEFYTLQAEVVSRIVIK